MSKVELDDILLTHAVDPDFVRTDDFEKFFTARAKVLLSKIGLAMGKSIPYDADAPDGEFEDEAADSNAEDAFLLNEQSA